MGIRNLEIFGNLKKTAIILSAGLISIEILWQIYKKTKQRRAMKKMEIINEVMIFSEELSLCRVHAITRIPCSRLNCSVKNLRKLCAYIESSQRNLDVCIYLLSSEDLAAAIIRSFLRGVVVRVIVDAGMAENSACDRRIRDFQEKGVKVRMKKSENLMHHKFAIIDEYIIITGSMNWTMQALHGNWDNVIVSNDKYLVKPFVNEFNRMWLVLTKDED